MFHQIADAAGTDFMHVMLFHSEWHIYQIILSILRINHHSKSFSLAKERHDYTRLAALFPGLPG